MHGVFVSGTGTGVGKTFVSSLLARHLIRRRPTVAIKPIETGCDPHPLDAQALGEACGRPGAVEHPAFYRARPAAGPASILCRGGASVEVTPLIAAVREFGERGDFVVVEGAGGAFVPLTEEVTTVDLIGALALPILLVAPDRLGVQSDVLAYVHALRAHSLSVRAVVLSQCEDADEELVNAEVLSGVVSCPILRIARNQTESGALASLF